LLQAAGANQAVVELSAGKQKWQAKILRSEGVIDPNNRSVYVVAGLPPRSDGEDNSLSPGLFVKAKIEAGSIKDVALVPQRALYGEDRVLVIEKVEESSRLSFREVEVARVVGDDVLISGGLQSGEIVCVTPLAAAVDGMEVKVLTTE